jgi:hypothetical protein
MDDSDFRPREGHNDDLMQISWFSSAAYGTLTYRVKRMVRVLRQRSSVDTY